MSPPSLRLITIPFSPFCEKARWAIEYVGLAFREDAYIPVQQIRPVKAVGGKTVPILVGPEGTFFDSTDILRFLDTRAPAGRGLYPTHPGQRRDVDALEEGFDSQLGPDVRLLMYYHLLPDGALLTRLVGRKLSLRQRLLLRALVPLLLRPVLRRRLDIQESTARQAVQRIRATFAQVASRLADGRPFLVADRFTAADLTFSALAAPLLSPPEHPIHSGLASGLPPALVELADELRPSPAGAFLLRMYRDHRRPAALGQEREVEVLAGVLGG